MRRAKVWVCLLVFGVWASACGGKDNASGGSGDGDGDAGDGDGDAGDGDGDTGDGDGDVGDGDGDVGDGDGDTGDGDGDMGGGGGAGPGDGDGDGTGGGVTMMTGPRSGFSIVSAGEYVHGQNFSAVLTFGEVPGGNRAMESSGYKLTLGLVGVTQD